MQNNSNSFLNKTFNLEFKKNHITDIKKFYGFEFYRVICAWKSQQNIRQLSDTYISVQDFTQKIYFAWITKEDEIVDK